MLHYRLGAINADIRFPGRFSRLRDRLTNVCTERLYNAVVSPAASSQDLCIFGSQTLLWLLLPVQDLRGLGWGVVFLDLVLLLMIPPDPSSRRNWGSMVSVVWVTWFHVLNIPSNHTDC